jgi:hypothetical protein
MTKEQSAAITLARLMELKSLQRAGQIDHVEVFAQSILAAIEEYQRNKQIEAEGRWCDAPRVDN